MRQHPLELLQVKVSDRRLPMAKVKPAVLAGRLGFWGGDWVSMASGFLGLLRLGGSLRSLGRLGFVRLGLCKAGGEPGALWGTGGA